MALRILSTLVLILFGSLALAGGSEIGAPLPESVSEFCERAMTDLSLPAPSQAPAIAYDFSKIPSLFVNQISSQVTSTVIKPGHDEKTRKARTAAIEFSNKEMKRRAFSNPDFEKERLDIAEEFQNRSWYIVVRDKETQKVTGTLGLTVAKGNIHHPAPEIERLPMENKYHWDLKRPTTASGDWVIIEFRTYAEMKAEKAKRGSGRGNGQQNLMKQQTHDQLWAGANSIIHEAIKEFPELMSEEIGFTYGDAASDLLYSAKGFSQKLDQNHQNFYPEVRDPHHPDISWHVLQGNPADILTNYIVSMNDFTVLGNRKNTLPAIIEITPDQIFLADQNEDVSFKGKQAYSFKLAKDTWVKPGLLIERGTQLQFHDNGRLRSIVQIKGNKEVKPGIIAKNQSKIDYTLEGNLKRVHLGEDHFFKERHLNVPAGSLVIFDENEKLVKVTMWAPDFEKEWAQGLFSAPKAKVVISYGIFGTLYQISDLARPIDIPALGIHLEKSKSASIRVNTTTGEITGTIRDVPDSPVRTLLRGYFPSF